MSGSRPRTGGCFVLALLAWSYAGSVARAQSQDPERTRLFREQYARAGRAYDAQDYATAIPALQAAFAIQPVAQILFNIAQAYRKLELYGSARVYFELYRSLDKAKNPENAELTDRLIVEMEELERAKAEPRVKLVEIEKTKLLYVQSEKPPPRWLRPVGIATGIGGIGLAVGGGTFLGLNGQCQSPALPPRLQCDLVYNSQTLGASLTAAGAAMLAISVATLALSFKRTAKPSVHEERPPLPPPLPPPPPLPREPIQIWDPVHPMQDEPPPAGFANEPPPTGWRTDGRRSIR